MSYNGERKKSNENMQNFKDKSRTIANENLMFIDRYNDQQRIFYWNSSLPLLDAILKFENIFFFFTHFSSALCLGVTL
jgi:hypothetical protein